MGVRAGFSGGSWCLRVQSRRTTAAVAGARPTTTVFVDSMALRFISNEPSCLVRVTNPSPSALIETVSGSIPVDCIGVVGINLVDRRGKWHYVELPDAFISAGATVALYPVQLAFAVLGARHQFDDTNQIVLSDGTCIPFGSTPSGYPLEVGAWAGAAFRATPPTMCPRCCPCGSP